MSLCSIRLCTTYFYTHRTYCVLSYLLQAQLDEFVAEHLTDTPTVGVHIRHGNGEKGHFARYNRGDRWSNMEAAVDEVI